MRDFYVVCWGDDSTVPFLRLCVVEGRKYKVNTSKYQLQPAWPFCCTWTLFRNIGFLPLFYRVISKVSILINFNHFYCIEFSRWRDLAPIKRVFPCREKSNTVGRTRFQVLQISSEYKKYEMGPKKLYLSIGCKYSNLIEWSRLDPIPEYRFFWQCFQLGYSSRLSSSKSV